MRQKLKELCGKRMRFIAHVVREGIRPNGYEDGQVGHAETLVLSHVMTPDDAEELAGHIWLDKTNEFAVEEGDIISFDAVVRSYTKGKQSRDYALRDPSGIEILKTAV